MRFSPAIAALALLATATPVFAQQQSVMRETDITELRLGMRVFVDDGSCPAGQIKEVRGSQMTAQGVVATRKCVPRLGVKQR